MRRAVTVSLLVTTAIMALGLAQCRAKTVSKVAPKAPQQPRLYTVEQRLEQYGPDVAARLRNAFSAAGVAYPPHELAYVAIKDQRQLQVYARNAGSERWRYVKRYQVLAASGLPGPKLREGDRQVPEGMYKAAFLNPNSAYHLSIRLNYPNDFDRQMAQRDKRSRLGGDIMIHGNAVSIGCLAMGDEGAEDLFVLAALVNRERMRIVVSPTDFRVRNTAPSPQAPAWTGELYQALRKELQQYPAKA